MLISSANAGMNRLYSDHDETCREQQIRLADMGAVQVLTNVAYTLKGTPASRNAAIALAKLAQHKPCHEQLREFHGFEIIHAYVKP